MGIRAWPYLFLAPFILCFLAFQMYPILYSLFASFSNWDGIGEKRFIGLKNYIRVFGEDPYFWKSVGNTLLIMLMSTPFVIVFGLVLAVLLFRLVKGRSFFQTVNFIPYITTPVALGLIFDLMFDWSSGTVNIILIRLGLIDDGINWLGEAFTARLVVALMIIWKYTGYHMAIYLAGLSTIPPDLYEAARVDGSGPVNTFFRITLPLLMPVTIFLILTDLIGGMQMFDEPHLLFTNPGGVSTVGGPDRAVLTVVWHFYDVTFAGSRFGYGSAVAFSLFLLIFLFTMFGYKLLNRGEKE